MKHFSVIAIIIMLMSCKKNDKSTNSPSKSNNKMVVFTNISDTRLAEIETEDGRKVIFFGQRQVDGSPKLLTGYTISSLSDLTKSDFVGVDATGRYSNIILRTGEKLHMDYYQKDSVKLTVSGPDTIIDPINVKLSALRRINGMSLYNVSYTSNYFGRNNSINIKVTKKNKTTLVEDDVRNDETVVLVRVNAGQDHDYTIQAQYNSNNGLYVLPLSSAGITFNDDKAVEKTVNFIKKALEVACTSPTTKDPNVDKSISTLIGVCKVNCVNSCYNKSSIILSGNQMASF